jgi:phytoene synthase
MRLDEAYARCEETTAREAKNFAYGIKLLDRPRRQAMSALYALARRIDDIGDGDADPPTKLGALAAVRKDVSALARGEAPDDDPVLVAMADVCRRWPVPLGAIDELIDGCEMDVAGARYDTFESLVGYCRQVAGTVGRLSLAIYGGPPDAAPIADDLGVALQLTNILRDIVEDRDMGRVYLPREDAERFGLTADLAGPQDAMMGLIELEASRALEWYDRGLRLLPLLERRPRTCTAAMAGIYRRLLDEIRRRPAAVMSGRISLPVWQKASVAARALAGVAP